jgi:6-phosphogluconolactonase
MKLIETESEEMFVTHAVELLGSLISAAISDHGSCILGLSGGSTPRPVYEALGKEQKPIDWFKVHLFLVDERYVPPDDPRSNQFLLRSTLLMFAPIPASQLYFPDTSLSIEECTQEYAQHLHGLLHAQRHLPDLVTLGLGEDGHVASLFPPLPQHLMDDTHLVAHTTTNTFEVSDRITLTLNPIAAVGSHVFLLRRNKKQVWDEMLASPEGETRWPAKRVLEQPDVTVIWGP